MIARRRNLIVAIVMLIILDTTGVVAMIISPDLTARLIPSLVAIQILGFIVIATICLRQVPKDDEATKEMNPASYPRDWRIWFICGVAMLFLFRALLAVAYIASNGWRRHQIIVPLAGFLIACYLLYLAFAIKKRSTRRP